MSIACRAEVSCLGFYTVVEDPQFGLFGGYLVLDRGGRPMEFHCTAPLKPNRAQQILYGPTLRPFLLGEQIGRTLVRKSSLTPSLILVESIEALSLRSYVDPAVALVVGREATGPHEFTAFAMAKPRPPEPLLERATAGGQRLGVAAEHAQDLEQVEQVVAALPESFDLAEPFGRIREAILEAQRSAA
jgi:hypothetical protein